MVDDANEHEVLDSGRLPPLPESRYPSNPECKHPERWNAVDGGATEVEVTELVAAFVRALQPDLVLETGSYHGQTTKAIGEALVRNGQGQLISLEWNKYFAAIAKEKCKGLPVRIVHGNSLKWEPPGEIQFAFFDSNLKDRHREFLRFYPWLRGIVGFHDTGPHHPVLATLQPLVERGLLRIIELPTPRGVVFGQVLR